MTYLNREIKTIRKMRFHSNQLIKLGLFAFLVGFIFACKSTKDVANVNAPQAENYDLEKSLLWKIEGKGMQEPSYLYGTIHMIEKESFFWPEGTLAAFEDAESITFEIDMDDMFDMGAQMGLLTKAFMADGKTLKDLYSAEDYEVVKTHFDGMGIPMFFMEKLKPMFLTVFASGDVEFGKGFGDESSIKSYEMEFFSLAQDANKDVSGLETIEYQMSVFDSIPYDAQAEMLLETIKSSDTEDDSFKEMIQMYKDQDISKMVSFMSEEEQGIEGYEDVLLYTRNKNWIPVMAKQMTANQVFFAVGAGHLGGKNGVIDLLKKEGYTLTPLSQTKG